MKNLRSIVTALLFPFITFAQGTVYLVLGSDTAIWDGLDVNDYHTTLGLSLYDDPSMNAYKVMDPAFREQFKDSYGTTMKMTWWMMAGNMYRYSTNMNVPLPNTMTMYMMKKYHGDHVKQFGDELSLHYHTFTWTDYNKDGLYFWNQAKDFNECREDFDVTMAQYLLDENIFPVSFRSGWHYMDNHWQNYIDSMIPYSLHNDYPAVRTSINEPIDNVYDWSKASKEYVPFHPSLSNYQLPGGGKSWNTRSRYMAAFSQADMDSVFKKALNGADQTPCLWAHLPEADFPQNMKRIDSLAHVSAAKFPTVKFRYCTAVEAMQRWRKGTDTIPPAVTITEVPSGDNISFTITTDEDIFQKEPVVALKDLDEQYRLLHCSSTGPHQWTTTDVIPRSSVAKVGVAVTDTMGNVSTAFKNFIPDDLYFDNRDPSYSEIRGTWTTTAVRAWGTDSRQCTLAAGDTAIVHWQYDVQDSGLYNLFFQVPKMSNSVSVLHFRMYSNGAALDSVELSGPFTANAWTYISTIHLTQPGTTVVEMSAYEPDQAGKIVSADVLKFSAFVKDRKIYSATTDIYTDPISADDSTIYHLTIQNLGIKDLTVSGLYSVQNSVGISFPLPLVIPGMKQLSIPLTLYSNTIGDRNDTIVFVSDDPLQPVYRIAFHFSVQPYFRIVDNEDTLYYSESGPWSKSVAQEWGLTSRYALTGYGASAKFVTQVKRDGVYEIFEIVPTTVNAVSNALYTVRCGADSVGSITIDQNKGSGSWVSLGQYPIYSGKTAEVKVTDVGPSLSVVLRADAVKFQLRTPLGVRPGIDREVRTFALMQNYPNPFNPATTIQYSVPGEMAVSITLYDMLGRRITSLVNSVKPAGLYAVRFDGSALSSGMYIYQMRAGSYVQSKVMMILK
jgi:hypothetical protein